MSSFINLMVNDIWSETDIISRTEAMIESLFPANTVNVMTRKLMGKQLGKYVMKKSEIDEVISYQKICTEAGIAAYAAIEDMKLLNEIIKVEKAMKFISLPFDALIDDQIDRDVNTNIVNNASESAKKWINLRNPIIEKDTPIPE